MWDCRCERVVGVSTRKWGWKNMRASQVQTSSYLVFHASPIQREIVHRWVAALLRPARSPDDCSRDRWAGRDGEGERLNSARLFPSLQLVTLMANHSSRRPLSAVNGASCRRSFKQILFTTLFLNLTSTSLPRNAHPPCPPPLVVRPDRPRYPVCQGCHQNRNLRNDRRR